MGNSETFLTVAVSSVPAGHNRSNFGNTALDQLHGSSFLDSVFNFVLQRKYQD